MKPKVYLAGPITGMTYAGCDDWRRNMAGMLTPDINAFSPMRSKQYLQNVRKIADSYEQVSEHDVQSEYPLSTQRGVYSRDFFDCSTCDLLIANLLGAQQVSIGTVMEIAWVAARQKPIILVIEDFNIHEHAMIREACPFRVNNLEDAAFLARSILLPRL